MNAELDSVHAIDRWELYERAVRTKWIYKFKWKANGSVGKYKPCLVAKGYAQQEGIDFETFVPTSRISIIKCVIALAAHHN